MPDLKLGKRPAKVDSRTFRLSRYMRDLPPAPPVIDWLSGITNWGMMRNDVLGDCTIAACGHAVQVWSAATGPEDNPTDAEIVYYYQQWCDYTPGRPDTDNGGYELDVLNHWRRDGLNGRRLVAYADPDPHNVEHVKQSIYLFGGVYIGLSLPLTAQDQPVWDVVGNPYQDPRSKPWSWGGHAVFVPYYDDNGLVCITWGRCQRMTWQFWETYCDESHCLLSAEWLDSAPAAFRLGDLRADLELIGD